VIQKYFLLRAVYVTSFLPQIPLLFADVIRQKLPVLALKTPSVLEGTKDHLSDHLSTSVCSCQVVSMHDDLDSLHAITQSNQNASSSSSLGLMSFIAEGLRETTGKLQELVPKYASCIVTKISQQCIHNLEPAHTIPRLYRRTNREVYFLCSW